MSKRSIESMNLHLYADSLVLISRLERNLEKLLDNCCIEIAFATFQSTRSPGGSICERGLPVQFSV